MKSGIYVVATPIGNLGDISNRARDVLQAADIIACEDTRVSKKLFSLLGLSLKKEFITFQDHNEGLQVQKLMDFVRQGLSVALISDAGSPLISDPGYHLIRRCKEQNIPVFTIPGACALVCALQLSGLPTDKFMFAGFIPNRDKARKDLFNSLKGLNATLVFYETANRILKTLQTAGEIFGSREMSVAREITKIYEECRNGSSFELIEYYSANQPKGEIVFMVSPPTEEEFRQEINLEKILNEEMRKSSLKTAVKTVVEKYGISKNEVYDLALKIKERQ